MSALLFSFPFRYDNNIVGKFTSSERRRSSAVAFFNNEKLLTISFVCCDLYYDGAINHHGEKVHVFLESSRSSFLRLTYEVYFVFRTPSNEPSQLLLHPQETIYPQNENPFHEGESLAKSKHNIITSAPSTYHFWRCRFCSLAKLYPIFFLLIQLLLFLPRVLAVAAAPGNSQKIYLVHILSNLHPDLIGSHWGKRLP